MKTTIDAVASSLMPLAAAIDIGSNALRLRIGGLTADRQLEILQQHREAVRLGHDAFTSGYLTDETITRVVTAFGRFREIIDAHPVGPVRAAATSALRDAKNSDVLIEQVRQQTGIEIERISAEEEAQLIHLAIRHRLPGIDQQTAMLIDIGGGSVEVSLCHHGDIIAVESFAMGTVRLLELFRNDHGEGADLRLLDEYIDAMLDRVGQAIAGWKIDLCVGSGGNIECLGSLGVQILANDRADRLTFRDLSRLSKRLQKLNYCERIEQLRLRPDRADVIIPATHVLRRVCSLVSDVDLRIPGAGLAEGILLALHAKNGVGEALPAHQAVAWAQALAKRFHADSDHAGQVARLADSLFLQTVDLHGLGERPQLLLRVACLIHEIGLSIGTSAHHRHAYYIASSVPMLGLTKREQLLIAALLRYQRKRFPDEAHFPCSELAAKQQHMLYRLTVLLRLAMALNKERKEQVSQVKISMTKDGNGRHLVFDGQGACMLEAWAVAKQAVHFENVFGVALLTPKIASA